MSLPISWVDRIFDKLNMVYGRDFIARWEQAGLSPAEVKRDWAHELSGFANWPEAIKFGLENLPPDRAPTVLQFRDICRRAPPKEVPRLPMPPADPVKAREALAKAKALLATKPIASKEWAQRHIDNHNAGGHVSPNTLRLAREALKRHQPLSAEEAE